MTENVKIVERIKALLAKAASTDHEAEAEAFFAKAYELMEKHQLSSSDLDRDDPLGNEHVFHRKGQASPDWDFRLLFTVAEYFGCQGIQMHWFGKHPKYGFDNSWLGYYMDLIGRESARITAIEMHKYLIATVRKLGREQAKKDPRLNADAWARRIGVALRGRIYRLIPKPEQAKTEIARANALITINQVQALVDKLYPNAKAIKGPGARTNSIARELAEGVGLNVQVNNSGVKQLR